MWCGVTPNNERTAGTVLNLLQYGVRSLKVKHANSIGDDRNIPSQRCVWLPLLGENQVGLCLMSTIFVGVDTSIANGAEY